MNIHSIISTEVCLCFQNVYNYLKEQSKAASSSAAVDTLRLRDFYQANIQGHTTNMFKCLYVSVDLLPDVGIRIPESALNPVLEERRHGTRLHQMPTRSDTLVHQVQTQMNAMNRDSDTPYTFTAEQEEISQAEQEPTDGEEDEDGDATYVPDEAEVRKMTRFERAAMDQVISADFMSNFKFMLGKVATEANKLAKDDHDNSISRERYTQVLSIDRQTLVKSAATPHAVDLFIIDGPFNMVKYCLSEDWQGKGIKDQHWPYSAKGDDRLVPWDEASRMMYTSMAKLIHMNLAISGYALVFVPSDHLFGDEESMVRTINRHFS